jgi:methylmalonyl-CoA mutase
MAENNFFKLLEASFPKSNRDDWKKTATKELNGNEPFTDLLWKDRDELVFYPYYDKEDLIDLHFYNNFNPKPSTDSFLGNRSWSNLPNVTVLNDVTANKIALEHLQNGADGILFDVSNSAASDIDKLLTGIQWEYCTLSFKGVNDAFVGSLSEYISKLTTETSKLHGGVFWEAVPQTRLVDRFRSCPNFFFLGVDIPQSSAIREIHDALVAGVSILDSAQEAESTFRQISFSINADTAFLNQIAKVKALRNLWYQVSQIYGIKNYQLEHLHIHVRSSAWVEKNFQPHGNMLKSTTAALSAIIGGCNSLTVLPEAEENTTMNRIARNVSSIVREESYLNKVADPLAGSFTLEVMTDKLSQSAWAMFQNTMQKQ